MFNFGSLATSNFTSSAGQYLRPYDIYKVNLTKIEKTTLKGSKDPNAEYPVVALEFTGCGDNKGVFSTNLFIPVSEEDNTRPTFKNNEGHEYNRPSRFENFQYILMQLVEVLNPAGAQKIKENASKIKSVDQFIDLIIKFVANKTNVETNLKLVGRVNNGVTYAALPNSCGLTKTGEIFPINFIGNNLSFTNYEISQQKAYQNAKPTNMDNIENNPDEKEDGDLNIDDIDVNDL